MSKAREYLATVADLTRRAHEGAQAALAELPAVDPLPVPTFAPEPLPFDRKALFDGIRPLVGGSFDDNEVRAIDRAIDRALGIVTPAAKIGISPEAFERAAQELEPGNLAHARAAIRAVDEVESGGGWFTDVRAEVLALDGPGGFLDGDELPKILFEAHKFDRHTGGKWRTKYPNLSSPAWNRALYVGGDGEYRRLHQAMQLDREAALKSASWGRYQILGENFQAAGFANVEAFVEAMKESEERHLEAFVLFIRSNSLVDEFRAISAKVADCVPFARAYNGPGYAANNYDGKIAVAFARWAKKLRG